MLYDCVQTQIQIHRDFVNTHLDMIHDITGLGSLEGRGLEAVLALEEEIKQASQRVTPTLQGPGWKNYPMTPVASSFLKGAGAYKGKLLVEYHHDPGNIWGYDVQGQGTEFFEELMLSGSKGGWIWDNILGKPSQFGMAKGKFFSFKDANGEQKFFTTPGAEFVHHFGRPAKFTYNPVGYLNDSEEWYNMRAKTGKEWKESLVDPSQSRNPIEASKLLAMQRNTAFIELQEMLKRRRAIEEVKPMIEKEQRRGTLSEISKLLKPHLPAEDFLDILQYLLDSQMTLTPVIDLVEDYKVKGYYANRGKPPKRTFIRRHTREEGTTIKDKSRLTTEKVRIAHAKSIREKRKDIVPLWRKLKDLKEKKREISEAIEDLYQSNAPDEAIQALWDKKREVKEQLEFFELPSIETLKNRIQWEKDNISRIKNLPKEEINLSALWEWQHGLERSKEELKRAEKLESELFDTHNDIILQYDFKEPLNEKIKVAKGIIYKDPFMFGMKIEHINQVFNKLPKNLRESCSEVRIFEIANDDPAYGSLKGCGGFYNPPTKTITLGLRNNREDKWLYSFGFVKEATIHEAAHALHFDRLSFDDVDDLMEYYDQNYNRLKNRGEYAAKNRKEFFAEGYAKLYLEDHAWFRGFTKGTKGFFQNIMQKYDFILDFIMTAINEKINGIKFSYQLNDKLIFGFFRIPEDISQEGAEVMVSEGKAQFENVDKYIDFGGKND